MKESLYGRLCSYLIAQKNELTRLQKLEDDYHVGREYIRGFGISLKIDEKRKHIESLEDILNQ